MMDESIIKALATGVAAALTTLGVLPLLFKGKIRHERELVAEQERCKQIDGLRLQQIAERDEENDRLLVTNSRLSEEIKEQNRTMAEQTREVLNAVKMLQGLAGLAASDRRRSRDS